MSHDAAVAGLRETTDLLALALRLTDVDSREVTPCSDDLYERCPLRARPNLAGLAPAEQRAILLQDIRRSRIRLAVAVQMAQDYGVDPERIASALLPTPAPSAG